ncbi:MAG TPA: hypothetical protein VLT59_03250 [Steroidobacteraceae bacterium]|nr:hypothetical protein [Steroidobacteraceae bacterium]
MGVIGRIIDSIAEVWLVAFALLIVLVAVFGLRRYRLVLGIVAAVLFGLAVYKRLMTPPMPDLEATRQERVTPPRSAVESLPLDLVAAEQLSIRGGGAPFTLSGTVANRSDAYEITSITLRATRLDCHPDALDPSGCDPLWQRDKWIDLTLAPGEERRFSVADWARDTPPRPRGTTRDRIELVRATGRRIAPQGV